MDDDADGRNASLVYGAEVGAGSGGDDGEVERGYGYGGLVEDDKGKGGEIYRGVKV